MIDFELLEWNHARGNVYKPTYDEAEDWKLSPEDRDAETVRRIFKYLDTVPRRKQETGVA